MCNANDATASGPLCRAHKLVTVDNSKSVSTQTNDGWSCCSIFSLSTTQNFWTRLKDLLKWLQRPVVAKKFCFGSRLEDWEVKLINWASLRHPSQVTLRNVQNLSMLSRCKNARSTAATFNIVGAVFSPAIEVYAVIIHTLQTSDAVL